MCKGKCKVERSINVKNEFPTVEELSNGFSEFKLEEAVELSNKEIELFYEDGQKVVYQFLVKNCLRVTCEGEHVTSFACIYSAVSPRNNLYFVDFIQANGMSQSVTTVLDFNKMIATTLTATLPSREQADISQLVRAEMKLPMTSVSAQFTHASIGSEFTTKTEQHSFTAELIGKTISFRYSSNDIYEHIYLNEDFYSWHCVSGLEKGLCDTDRCYYLKLDENLYWFTWLEKVVPTIGTVIEDLAEGKMRSYGKICGYENYSTGAITNFQVGSYATELSK